MSIKTNLEYEERLDAVVGFDDLGDNQRSNKIANYATVFMIRSLFGSWKQPVGYFLTSGPMTADTSKRKLLQCIDEVKASGLIPKLLYVTRVLVIYVVIIC